MPTESLQHIASRLLERYGIVFRKVLDREALLPTWRELLQVFRRMEARGEVRGGRFVQAFSGEQFASSDAVTLLRDLRRRSKSGELIALCASDPANLMGIVTPGEKLPASLGNRVLYRDGIPIAVQVSGNIHFLDRLSQQGEWEARNLLLKKHRPIRLPRSALGKNVTAAGA